MSKSVPAFVKPLAISIPLVAIMIVAFCLLRKPAPLECPFSGLPWNSTEQELFDAEGNFTSSYASTYGGLTYTYEKSYLNREGIIKYMFDEEGSLASVAWAYTASDADDLNVLYREIQSGVQELYGESEYHTANITNYGDVWKMKKGQIILSAMNVGDNIALQIAYERPDGEE